MFRKLVVRLAALGAAAGLLGACAEDQPGPTGPAFSVNGLPFTTSTAPFIGFVKVCIFAEPSVVGPITGMFSISASGGTVDTEETIGPSSTTLCSFVWDGTSSTLETVNVTMTGPPGFRIGRLVVAHTSLGMANDQQYSLDVANPGACTGTGFVPSSVTATVSDAVGAAVWFKLCPPTEEPPPPPPPGGCFGLTPGYWRNWANHYTEDQFLSLLQGTISAGNVAGANTILEYGGNVALEKLRKFTLANQITLSLMNHPDFPNPDDAELGLTCVAPGFPQGELGDVLEDALDILNANGVGFSRGTINSLKDILDAIANT